MEGLSSRFNESAPPRKCKTPPWQLHFLKLEIGKWNEDGGFLICAEWLKLISISSLANRVGKYGRFLRAIPAMGASQQGWLERDSCSRRQISQGSTVSKRIAKA